MLLEEQQQPEAEQRHVVARIASGGIDAAGAAADREAKARAAAVARAKNPNARAILRKYVAGSTENAKALLNAYASKLKAEVLYDVNVKGSGPTAWEVWSHGHRWLLSPLHLYMSPVEWQLWTGSVPKRIRSDEVGRNFPISLW